MKFDAFRNNLTCKLAHDELVRLLVPLIRNDQPDLLDKLVKVCVFDEFYQNRQLGFLSKNEFHKVDLFVTRSVMGVSYDQLFNTLKKENFVGVLAWLETLFCLYGDLVQITDFNKLKTEMMGTPDLSLEEYMFLF